MPHRLDMLVRCLLAQSQGADQVDDVEITVVPEFTKGGEVCPTEVEAAYASPVQGATERIDKQLLRGVSEDVSRADDRNTLGAGFQLCVQEDQKGRPVREINGAAPGRQSYASGR
jgi:hypothetical protein